MTTPECRLKLIRRNPFPVRILPQHNEIQQPNLLAYNDLLGRLKEGLRHASFSNIKPSVGAETPLVLVANAKKWPFRSDWKYCGASAWLWEIPSCLAETILAKEEDFP